MDTKLLLMAVLAQPMDFINLCQALKAGNLLLENNLIVNGKKEMHDINIQWPLKLLLLPITGLLYDRTTHVQVQRLRSSEPHFLTLFEYFKQHHVIVL